MQIMKNIFGKIRTIRIGKYFNNLLYGYIRLNERDTNKVYSSQNTFLILSPLQICFLISKLQFNAIFDSYSTYLSAIF